MSGALPLRGLRIVEYARDLPARYAGFLLADLGAEVRALRSGGDDRHPVLDRRKRIVDLTSAAGRTAFRDADAVLADRRIDGDVPDDVVWCEVSGWGRRGPRCHDPYDEALVTAVAGVQTFQWSWSGGPVWLVTPIVGYFTGILAALGVTAGLFARRRGAGGQRLSVSALAAAFTLNCGRLGVEVGR